MAVNAPQALPTWRDGAGIRWLTATDHKRIGVMHLLGGLAMLAVAGICGLILMLDLDHGRTGPIDAFAHLQLNLLQNTAGLFAIALPIALGLAVYLVPLMVGARELVGAQLATVGFWLWLGGALLMLAAPGAGNPGLGATSESKEDATGLPLTFEGRQFWVIGLLLVSIAAALTCLALLATIAKGRAPGLTAPRLPLFVLGTGIFSVTSIVSSVVLGLACVLFLVDASVADFFAFDVVGGGESGYGAFYQNPIWFMAHPLVPGLVVVALAGLSEVVAVHTRNPLRLRTVVLLGLATLGGLSILLSMFHLAANGLSDSLLRGIPIVGFLVLAAAAVVVVGWLDSFRLYRPKAGPPPAPLLFAVGAVVILAVGGILGLVWGFPGNYNGLVSIHLSAFYLGTIGGGLILAFLGCLHHWFPKVTGRALDERGALAQFGLTFVGAGLLTLGLHVVGDGTRVILDSEVGGTKAGGVIALIGFLLLFLGVAGFVAETAKALVFGRRVGNDPWQADTLEWLATSPPAEHNFDRLPPIESARPLADLRDRIAAQARRA